MQMSQSVTVVSVVELINDFFLIKHICLKVVGKGGQSFTNSSNFLYDSILQSKNFFIKFSVSYPLR